MSDRLHVVYGLCGMTGKPYIGMGCDGEMLAEALDNRMILLLERELKCHRGTGETLARLVMQHAVVTGNVTMCPNSRVTAYITNPSIESAITDWRRSGCDNFPRLQQILTAWASTMVNEFLAP